MVRDRILKQGIKIDGNPLGIRWNCDVNRRDFLGIPAPGQRDVAGLYPQRSELLNGAGRSVLAWNPQRIRERELARPHANFLMCRGDASGCLGFVDYECHGGGKWGFRPRGRRPKRGGNGQPGRPRPWRGWSWHAHPQPPKKRTIALFPRGKSRGISLLYI